ncbi:hypothetical protein U2F26_25585 [Micromonospora sp. 4G57]|uniref:AAA domain-containing protein n=1 Tax=Micromonospora sicca TaxID=2202420 RepID=A0ABU5JJI7_9ACTN|nr:MULTISPECIES: hypothetical protein [unclassified Micromonospora]MDZ5446065.1 hypothetical protein [Micromonospora sp. 4G57]MDZ5492802.1 hypothetical protein [Micromonospora sp. 4G53]
MTITFSTPAASADDALHHEEAAKGNIEAAQRAISALSAALSGAADYDKILLRAAAGAGKSYALVRMVREGLDHANCTRVAVTAFANKQVFPLAGDLGKALGAAKVCLFVAQDRLPDVPQDVRDNVSVATTTTLIPSSCEVVLGTSHKLGALGERRRLLDHLGSAGNDSLPFDVLFVDEAWQLPRHRYSTVEGLAPISVGVGDVGQLPPIDPSQNPWRGDPGYNPYRAWPTAYEGGDTTCVLDLPAVWRPTAAQLPLWRAFYSDWDQLNCVAGPGDRSVELPPLTGATASIWASVASGNPTLLEVDGLPAPEAADIDLPLLGIVEELLTPLLAGGFSTVARQYDGQGKPLEEVRVNSAASTDNPLIVILATRNQTVDDATELVERLAEKYDLPDGVLVASTVDSWQGQTNAITVAIHPLSGAEQLDEFNSAFGRLAVTCTRATHGLLMVARSGLNDLLSKAPARPGTPLGEPGSRSLPRQTHQRILAAFSRSTLTVNPI